MTLDEVLLYVILGCIVAAVVGIGVGYLLRKRIAEARIGSAEERAKQIADDAKKMLESASREAETLKKETLVQTKEEIHKLREDVEQESSVVTSFRSTSRDLSRRKIILTGEAGISNSVKHSWIRKKSRLKRRKTRLKLYIASRKRNWKKYPSYHVHRQRI